MEIKINSEDVNKVVAEAIIKSALGTHLQEAINKAMTEAVSGYNSPVKILVEQHIKQAIREVLETHHRQKIVELIAAKLTGEHINAIVEASVNKAVDMLSKDRY